MAYIQNTAGPPPSDGHGTLQEVLRGRDREVSVPPAPARPRHLPTAGGPAGQPVPPPHPLAKPPEASNSSYRLLLRENTGLSDCIVTQAGSIFQPPRPMPKIANLKDQMIIFAIDE
uniref:Uncharacterized protein n=1 Tax=Spironucleus salmonicida TaxID=348837 RepID=V6LIC5_9EUKA|eukprot:EST44335.1 Hypothetical protein SS50377_15875 [Spironucleus salmonicida]